jgi:hypothetical protein
MTDIYANIGTATVASRGFLPLAVEAGICTTIKSLISGLAVDARSLLLSLKGALAGSNAPLAAALNLDNLSGIIAYMQRAGEGIMPASGLPVCNLPVLLDEDGPASVAAARDGGTATQVNITIPESASGYTEYEIYLDGVYVKTGSVAASGGWINDNIQGVASDGEDHTVRVLFVDTDAETGEERQTRFGPVAAFA